MSRHKVQSGIAGAVVSAAVAMLGLALPTVAASGGIGISYYGGSGISYGNEGLDSPDGSLRYYVQPAGPETAFFSVESDGGKLKVFRPISGDWRIPSVTFLGDPAGLSHDGRTLVVTSASGLLGKSSTFLLVDTAQLKPIEEIRLNGAYTFDAISPDGETLFVVSYPNPRDTRDYEVLSYDVAAGKLDPDPILPANDPDEEMRGTPLSRVTGADGRWEYTLYDGGAVGSRRNADDLGEPFVHALDTVDKTALCIDLPWLMGTKAIQTVGAIRLDLSEDGSTVEVVNSHGFADSQGDLLGSIETETHLATEASEPVVPEPAAADEDEDGDDALLVPIGAGIAGLGALAIAFGFARRRRAGFAPLGNR